MSTAAVTSNCISHCNKIFQLATLNNYNSLPSELHNITDTKMFKRWLKAASCNRACRSWLLYVAPVRSVEQRLTNLTVMYVYWHAALQNAQERRSIANYDTHD